VEPEPISKSAEMAMLAVGSHTAFPGRKRKLLQQLELMQ
jgi:hypothetical protein